MSSPTAKPPTSFVLPDLQALTPFPTSCNPHYAAVAAESSSWIAGFPDVLSDVKRTIFLKSLCELLCAHTYPYAGYEQFRTTCDSISMLFIIDEISDDQDEVGAWKTGSALYNAMKNPKYEDETTLGKMSIELAARLRALCRPLTYRRLMKHCKAYIDAVAREADLRVHGIILDLDAYVALRRENSGVRFCHELASGVLDVDLPDEVVEHPKFLRMHLAAVDMVCWANDLYSYNVEQAKGHTTNNILTVLMHDLHLDLQGAADHVAEHFKNLMETYLEAQRTLPSWGVVVDQAVGRSAMAMECWVVGNLQWSFETKRYFGDANAEVRTSRVVQLYPREVQECGHGEDGDD